MIPKKWMTYEEVATSLLMQYAEQIGLTDVEGKQNIDGKLSGTSWEIDAKALRQGGNGFVIVECRRYTTSKQSQGKAAQLAWIIHDTGADGGIFVTPLGLQEGAEKVAQAANIKSITLPADSTVFSHWLRFSKSTFEVQNITSLSLVGCIVTPEITSNSDGEEN